MTARGSLDLWVPNWELCSVCPLYENPGDHMVSDCSGKKPHSLAHHLRSFVARTQSISPAPPALCLPKRSSHVAASELSTIPQTCHPFGPLHVLFPCSHTPKAQKSLPMWCSPWLPGQSWGALSWAPVAFRTPLLCYVSLRPCVSCPGPGPCWRDRLCCSCLFIPRQGTESTVHKHFWGEWMAWRNGWIT